MGEARNENVRSEDSRIMAESKEPAPDIHERIVEIVEKPSWKALLLNIVKSEGLDPWDIDVSLLASRFADRVRGMKELNLKVPANAVLASSILLRFKSDNWVFFPNLASEEEEEAGDGQSFDKASFLDGVEDLPALRRITRRKVTLDDLIRAIESVMEKEIRKARKKGGRPNLVVETTSILRDSFYNEEEFDLTLNRTWLTLNAKKDTLGLVLFSDLIDGKDRTEVIKTLLSLLHLANNGRVSLWQEEFFGDIIIRLNNGS